MTSFSNSSFLMKFQKVEGNYENLIKLFEAPAIISEDEGYEAFLVNFLLYYREPKISQQRKLGSCFELLRRLVKNDNSAMPLNKDTLVTILTRNTELLEDLKVSFSSENVPEFDPNERELIIAVENSFFRIPTFDFAMVRQEENIFICTTLENDHNSHLIERIFLRLKDFSPALEGILKNFMRKPEIPKSHSLSFPILPSIDTNNLVIQPSKYFEKFIDESENIKEDQKSPNYQNNDLLNNSKMNISNSTKNSSIPTSKSFSNRRCLHCFCSSTPMWRRGPDGKPSLCNACGVKYKAGKIHFSPENVEINQRKIQQLQSAQVNENQETFTLQNEELTFHQY